MNKQITIGLDAGATTGLAVFDAKENAVTQILSTDFAGAIKFFHEMDKSEADKLKVVVEQPPRFVYARNEAVKGHSRDTMIHKMGGNAREAELLADAIEGLGFEVHRVPPIRQTKWTAEQFKRYTKYEGRTNEHVRDAGRLAFSYAGRIIK